MPAPVPSQPSHTPPQQADRQPPNVTPLSIPTGPQPTMPHTAAETQQQPTPPDHPPSPSSSSSTASTNSTTSTSSTSSSSTMPRAPPAPHQQPQQFRQALESLDQVDLDTVLKQKFFGFQSPPPLFQGRIRQALATALDAINAAETEQQTVRAWKLWLLLPRMLLHRQPGARTLPKPEWYARIQAFQFGQWLVLLQRARATAASPANPPQEPQPDHQTRRACQLIHQGERGAVRRTAGPHGHSTGTGK